MHAPGLPASFVHASEWAHGELGALKQPSDLLVVISHSGQTEECVNIGVLAKVCSLLKYRQPKDV